MCTVSFDHNLFNVYSKLLVLFLKKENVLPGGPGEGIFGPLISNAIW